MPNLNERLNKIAEIISELREPFETAQDIIENEDEILKVKLRVSDY